MRRLTSAPKPSPRVAVHVDQVVVSDRAVAVVDAVVAGQVARRLGRGHQVVGRDGVRAVRQRHLLAPWRRGPRTPASAARTACSTSGSRPAPKYSRATPMVSGLSGCRAFARIGRHRLVRRWCCRADRGRRSTSSSRAASVTSWANGPTWSSELAKATRPIARHAAVGRLEADDAAQAGRLADRAAGVGAQRQRRLAGRHRRRRAAAGAAGDALQVPGIARHLEGAVLRGRAHGELVHVGLAEQHGVGLLQPGDRRGRRRAA